MRRLAVLLLAVLLFCQLAGCGRNAAPTLSDVCWELKYVQRGEDGGISYVGSEEMQGMYPGSTLLAVTGTFSGEELILTADDSGEEWHASYRLQERGAAGDAIYTVCFPDGTAGLLSVGTTRYADGSREETLLLSAGGYVCTFSGGVE